MTRARPRAHLVAGGAFIVVALALAAVAVYRSRHELAAGLHRLSAWSVLLSLTLGAGAVAATLPMWRSVLRGLDVDLPFRPAARVYFVGQLGKYVPGSVWTVIAQMELARRYAVPRTRVLAGGVLAIAINALLGTAIAMGLLPFVNPSAFHRFYWLLILLPLLLVALHPRIVVAGLELVLRVLRRQPLGVTLSLGAELRTAAWGLLSWLLLGGHIYVLVSALGASGLHALAASITAGCLAFAAGTLFVPVPAGAGVREVAFVLTLGAVLDGESALLVALLSRVTLIVADVGLAGIAALRREAPPTPASWPAPRGRQGGRRRRSAARRT